MSRAIACPSCQRQYQVKGDPTGKSMKCPACQTVFQVPAAPAAAPVARTPMEVPATSNSKLFPDPNSIPRGPDPLANHVVHDPGFADVDVDEVRRQREAAARKKGNLENAYSSSSSLAKLDEEKAQNKTNKPMNTSLFGMDTLFGFDGRIPRQTWWLSALLFWFLSQLIVGSLIGAYGLILYVADVDFPQPGHSRFWDDQLMFAMPIAFLLLIYVALNAWVTIALNAKRFHDLGHDATRMFIMLVPLLGIYFVIELGFFKGQARKNQYGPDPLKGKH